MSRPPYNIVWIAVDSLKATALPVYGNPFVIAPESLRLAREGVTFTHAFAQMPKCVPSRPSQLTGRYPHCEGMRALRGKAGADRARDLFVIEPHQPNLIRLLKDLGYTTCSKGPNHLVSWDVYEQWFDVTTDWEPYKRCLKPPATDDPELGRAQYAGPVPDDFDLERTTDAETTRQMCAFLQSAGKGPFFAYLDIRAPHPPYRHWPPFWREYETMDVPVPPKSALELAPWLERVYREAYALEGMSEDRWRAVVRAYYSAVSFDDMLVGRVLDAIEFAGLRDSTIVIYSSDHGDFAGEHGCVEKHDTFLYDCLTRLPLVMRLPSAFPGGRRFDVLAEMVDIAPTLLDLCGLEIPRWMQGRSLVPTIMGRSDGHKDAVFAQGGLEKDAIDRLSMVDPDFFYSKLNKSVHVKQKVILDHPDFMMRAKMVRTRRCKYIYRLNGHHEFYDLEKDPGELRNEVRNPAYAGAVAELREMLIRWMIESETNLPLIDQVWA